MIVIGKTNTPNAPAVRVRWIGDKPERKALQWLVASEEERTC